MNFEIKFYYSCLVCNYMYILNDNSLCNHTKTLTINTTIPKFTHKITLVNKTNKIFLKVTGLPRSSGVYLRIRGKDEYDNT